MGSIVIKNTNPVVTIIYENMVITLNKFVAVLSLSIIACLIVGLYLLMGFGLKKMARKKNVENANLAFVPFARWYLLGKITGDVKLFNKSFKNFGRTSAIVILCCFAVTLLYTVLYYLPLVQNFFYGNTIEYEITSYGTSLSDATLSYYYVGYNNGAIIFINVLMYLSEIAVLCYAVFQVFILNAAFRKYSPDRAFIMTFFSVILIILNADILGYLLTLSAVFVFALRNREQVDFAEYMRNKYHYMNQGTGGPNMGGPSNGGSYNGSDNFQRPKDPFGEFSNKKDNPEEPFGEFDKDDKDKR